MRKYYKYKMNLTLINIISIIIFIIPLVPCIKIVKDYILNDNMKACATLLGAYLFWMIFHEALHGIGHLLCGSSKKDLSFGACIEKGVLFCLIRKEVHKKQILTSLIFPFFFIGVVTYIIGLIINSPLLVLLSVFNISGASADLIMFLDFIKLDKDITYIEPGDGTSFYLMADNLKNKKLFGLVLEEEGEYKEDMFKDRNYKIFDISKTSIIVFVVILIFLGLCMFL